MYDISGTQIMGLSGLITNVGCGDFNENGLCRYLYLNTWATVGRTFGEELGIVALLEEVL